MSIVRSLSCLRVIKASSVPLHFRHSRKISKGFTLNAQRFTTPFANRLQTLVRPLKEEVHRWRRQLNELGRIAWPTAVADIGSHPITVVVTDLFGASVSQGYDLVERPLLRSDEPMRLAANMNMAVHPGFFTPTNFAFICDNFLIKPDGTQEHLHKYPQEYTEL